MRRPLLAAALTVLAAACGAGRGVGASPFPVGGRFRAEHVARLTTTLIDGPGWATYCASDSVLVIVALGRTWSGGLALRTFPLGGAPGDFRVQLALGDLGSATAAFRTSDAGPARVGTGGSVRVAVTSSISGRFDIALPDSGRQHESIRGVLTRIPVSMLPAATCSPI